MSGGVAITAMAFGRDPTEAQLLFCLLLAAWSLLGATGGGHFGKGIFGSAAPLGI